MTIRSKMTLLFLLGFSIGASYVVQFWIPKSQSLIINALADATDRELFHIAEVLMKPILKNESEVITQSLSALEDSRTNWVSLKLVAVDSQLLYPFSEHVENYQTSQIILNHSINFRHEPIATLTLIIDFKKELQALNKQNIELFGALLGGFFVFFLMLMFILERLIRLPISTLSYASKQLALGNFSIDLPAPSDDEMGFLVSGFHKMREKTKQDQKRIVIDNEIKKDLTHHLLEANEMARLVDTANAPIFGIDANGSINEWNKQSERITGYIKEEVLGLKLVSNFITDDYKIAVRNVLDKALNGEEAANYEFPLFTKNGERVDVLLNSTSRRDAAGKIIGVVGVGQDITELNKALKEQHSIALDMTQLVDTANAPIFGIDAYGSINEWNKQSEIITGYTKSEVLGLKLVNNFITDDYKTAVRNVLDKALNGEETANYEFPLFTKSGERVDVLLNSTSRRDAAGKIIGVVGVGQDITELNKALKEQHSIALDMTQLVDTANAPIFGIDAYGSINEWNKQSEIITGYTKSEVLGLKLVNNFITDDYKTAVRNVLDKALNGEETANYEFPLFTKSGERVDVLLNSTSRRDAAGKIIGVVGVGQDITELNKVRNEQEVERKEATAQLIQASKLATLGEMATSVAHELNQPLNVIRMAAGNSLRRISKGTAEFEYLNDKLKRIDDQTMRAAAIIDHMRVFGRKANEEPEPIDPRTVITNALELMGEQLRLIGIEVVTQFPKDCHLILGHSIQVEQVILNLLMNARDALAGRDGEKKITLRIFEDNKNIHITSEDNGGGIPSHFLPRIFEPFYTTKEVGKGTGLGLSISYGIITDMRGTIAAKNIDGGCRFILMLPFVN